MEKLEIIEIIETIITSIKEKPNQFTFKVMVIWTQAISNWWIWIMATANWWWPCSTTIWYNSSVSNNSIQIANDSANAEIDKQFSLLIESLNLLIHELKKENPSKEEINGIYNSLKKEWVPWVIIWVIWNMLSKFIWV